MKIAAFCGTFDPVTYGHLDIIERASKLFDQLVVFISPNSDKNNEFTEEKRLKWLNESTKHLSNVTCKIQSGLVVRVLIASAAVSTLFVTTAFVTPVFAEPENQVETLENQKSEVEAQADSINSQLVSLLVSYKALQQDIENQQVRIGEVGQDLAVAQENEQKQYEDMKLRIKYMYENGDASFAEAILTATS